MTVTRVSYLFRDAVPDFPDGFIDVDGGFDGEDICWSVHGGTFRQQFVPTLNSQDIVFTPKPPKPQLNFNLELNFLCVVGAAAIDFLDFAFTQAMFLLFGPTLAKTLGVHGSFESPTTAPTSEPALTFGGVTWNRVVVSPEGLVLLGDRIGGGVVSPAQQPAVHLRTKDDPQNLHAVVQGSVTVQGPTCQPQAFDYVESIQDDRNTLTVDSEWLFEPIDYAWTVNGQALTDPSEVLVLGAGDMSVLEYTGTVKTALPPPNGTAISGHAIKLLYRVAGRTLLLSARNEDANYDIRVEVRATDALGRVFRDAVNLTMVGDIAEFGPDYDDYMDRCIKAAADRVNKKGRQKSKVRPGEPQEQWRDLLDAVTQQVREGNAEAEAMISGLMKAVGVEVVGKALAGKVKV